MQRKVLIVDPDDSFRDELERDFAAIEFAVATATAVDRARVLFDADPPDLVVLDLSFGPATLQLVRDWVSRAPAVVVVLVSGAPTFMAVVDALSQGAKRFCPKPIRASEILQELTEPTHELGMASLDAEGVDRFFAISPGLLAIQSFDGFFTLVNPAWEKTLGYTAKELCSTPYLELVHPDDRLKASDEALEITGGKAVFRFRNRYRCKDGSYRWLAWSATPSPAHRLIYASARDVTAVVRMEQGLRESNERLKLAVLNREEHLVAATLQHANLVELDRFKDEVTVTLVHDLKNPLSVIVANYDYILACFEGPADCLEALQDSQSAGHRMLRLLSNLVDVARRDVSGIEVQAAPVSLTRLIQRIATERRVMANIRQVTISVAPGPEMTAVIDADKLARAVENILDNALRYAPRGGSIEIAMSATATDHEIRIGNSGSAIPVELREIVFARYGQEVTTIGSMNLGLGLHFCRATIEAHGGRIWIEQTERLPTVFVIQLPRPHASSDPHQPAAADVGLGSDPRA